MRTSATLLAVCAVLMLQAQTSNFDQFRQQQRSQFAQFQKDQQAQYDEFRRRVNEEYAEYMRRAWKEFPVHEADRPVVEQEVKPVVYEAPAPQQPQPEPQPQTKPQEQPHTQSAPAPVVKENIESLPVPQENLAVKPAPAPAPVAIPVKPVVMTVPAPEPAPEPIAPVQPKEQPFKRVSVSYFGSLVTIGFPNTDKLQLKSVEENAIADAWKILSGSDYDITVKTALDARKANDLCDWGYMDMLRKVCEKQYGRTNEAVVAQAFLMVQSGYRIRLGNYNRKLQLLVASSYDIYGYKYFVLDGAKFYVVSGDQTGKMNICESKYGKERSLSMQIARLPKFTSEPTPKRTLTSKKGVTASASVNKNLIDFFNTYPQACFNGDYRTRWAAYANTPLEPTVQNALYTPLKKTIAGMSERQAVEILLNWVQTAFEYELDDKVWGHDRAFFAQETLYYPYCDCEDRSILFSRLVRDLLGLDVVLLYYPGHLATAVAFSKDEKGDWLTYKKRKYTVCDPTYINAGVGLTMPGMNNQEAQVIALQ